MTELNIGNVRLPSEAVTHSFGLLAVRGAGKTNAARVLAEEMFDAGLPFVAVDPVGSWWGLRAGRDGAPEGGLKIPILGGRHADLPLHRSAGLRIAQLIVETNLSCVLDLSDMESEAAKKTFLLDFARELYARNQTARHIFLEEADDYIPQRPMRDELQLKRAWENIVRRGRSRGLGFTLITQRSACVNKDVLTQVETLFVLRTTGPQDRAAVEAWVAFNDSGISKEDLKAVPNLPSGEAFCWSPRLIGKSIRVKFRLSRTFDSGATPKPGEAPKAATLADVDLDAVRGELEALDPGSEDDEPSSSKPNGYPQQMAKLRNQLAELERELAAAREGALPEATVGRLEAAAQRAHDTGIALVEAARDVMAALPGRRSASWPAVRRIPIVGVAVDEPGRREQAPKHTEQRDRVVSNGSGANDLSKCARAILTALYQHGDLSLVQAAIIAGYASDSGGVRNAAGELRSGGYVEGSNAKMGCTDLGCEQVRDAPKLPTGKKLAEYWFGKLERAERLILGEVLAAYPKPIALKAAASRAGYEPDSGGVRNAASKLRTLMLVHGGNAGMTADRRLV